MTTKEYLHQLKDLDDLVHAIREDMKRKEDMLTNTSVKYKEIQVQTSGAKDKMFESIPEIEDLRSEMEQYLIKLSYIEVECMQVIKKIQPLRLQTVLIKYYCQNKTFEQVAVEMDKSYQWVCELHGRALVEYEKIQKDMVS